MPRPPESQSPDTTIRPADPDLSGRCQTWYDAYGRAVYRFLRFQVDSSDTADDLTADVFLRVLEAAGRYDPTRDPRAWIFSIARNAMRDHFRRFRIRRHVTLGALRDLAADAPSPEERLIRQEQIALLLEGVRRLPGADRELIGLRYGSELDCAQIGEILDLRET